MYFSSALRAFIHQTRHERANSENFSRQPRVDFESLERYQRKHFENDVHYLDFMNLEQLQIWKSKCSDQVGGIGWKNRVLTLDRFQDCKMSGCSFVELEFVVRALPTRLHSRTHSADRRVKRCSRKVNVGLLAIYEVPGD